MRLPYNPLKRVADSAVKQSNTAATSAQTATTPGSASSAKVGDNDATTGVWMPYGLFGITPNNAFLVPGRE